MSATTNPVRAAGLIIYRVVNNSIEYLLLQSSRSSKHWTPPKGHVDPGEDEWQAALRETKEEASIDADLLDIHKDKPFDQSYTNNEGLKTVRYWLARLKVYDVKLSDEHMDHKWLSLEPAIDLVKFKEMQKTLRDAEEYLKTKDH